MGLRRAGSDFAMRVGHGFCDWAVGRIQIEG